MLATFMSLILLGAPLAQRAPYDIRTGNDLARLRTFGFKPIEPDRTAPEKSTTYDSPIVDERTNRAIAAELERRGLTRDDRNPDVWVVTRRTFRTEQRYYPYPDPWYANGWGWPYGGDRYVFDQASIGAIPLKKGIWGSRTIALEGLKNDALLWCGAGDEQAQ